MIHGSQNSRANDKGQFDLRRTEGSAGTSRSDLWPELAAEELYVETRFVDDPVVDKREIIVVSVHPPGDVTWSRWNKK